MIRSAQAVFLVILAVCAFGCRGDEPVAGAGPAIGAAPAPGEIGGMPNGKPLGARPGMAGQPRKLERAMSNPGMDPNGSMTALQRSRPDPNPKRKAEPIFFGVNIKPEMSGGNKLKADGALVEVAGTCDVSPDAVTCWKPDGTPNESLSKLVRAALQKPERKFQGGEFANDDPNSQKVRGVAVKVTPGSPVASSLMSIVNDNSASPMSRLPFEAEGVRYGLAIVRVDPSESQTSVSVALASPTAIKGEVACEEDAKGSFDGQEFGVTSIKESAARVMAGPGEAPTPASAWRVSLRFREAVRNYENVTLQLIDKAGKAISFSDDIGNPAKKGRPAVSAANAQRDGTLIFTLTVVPSKIGKLVLKGNRVKVVELTGVRLDPLK